MSKNKDIDLNQIEDTFKVNFFGTLYSIKAVEKYFKDSKLDDGNGWRFFKRARLLWTSVFVQFQ